MYIHIYIYTYIHIHIYIMCVYIHIYIYIYMCPSRTTASAPRQGAPEGAAPRPSLGYPIFAKHTPGLHNKIPA